MYNLITRFIIINHYRLISVISIRDVSTVNTDFLEDEITLGSVNIATGAFSAGFECKELNLLVISTEDIFEALDIQDELQTLYTSGTVFHAFLGEKLPDWKAAANLVRKIAENYKLPYYTISPTYSVCSKHGYIKGEVAKCPICDKKTEIYSRITGYYRPVQNWNDGKSQEFKERKVNASCDLFEVEITINDGSIKFPYLFKSTYYDSPYFTVNVKMKYLGKTFSYTSPDGYLDGATVSFVNNDSSINCEGWGATCEVKKFVIMTGMEIEREYRYHEDLNAVNEVGIYDMVITYENDETNLKESIVIKDFLQVTR